ncbi:hypothetical protein [Enterovirga sp.]|uniref:hypothetical protein n=1 Tax=Enterovirga sp. TaxID=2026350 RepID=UPI002BB0A666|nr:hypothetical protein [Enterovirga sp.]HMO27757.1 hypothetical protein [Enterovirga sp.]
MLDYGGTMLGSPCETILLGRIGSELAVVLHDTLQSPLPEGLQLLVERLDRDLQAEDDASQES